MHGPIEAAFHTAHGFMPAGAGAVKAETEALNAVRFQSCEDIEGQICGCARRNRNGQA